MTASVYKIGDLAVLRFGGILKNPIAGTGTTLLTVDDNRVKPYGDTGVFVWGNYSTVSYPIVGVGASIKTNGTVVSGFGAGTLSGAIYILTSCYITAYHPAP